MTFFHGIPCSSENRLVRDPSIRNDPLTLALDALLFSMGEGDARASQFAGDAAVGLSEPDRKCFEGIAAALSGASREAPRADHAEEAPPVERVGPFRLLRRIGAGSFSDVYIAEEDLLRRHAAVKLLRPSAERNGEQHAAFLREARAIAQLKHPNVVRVIGAGDAGSWLYVAMEYVEGHGLDEIVHAASATRHRIAPSLAVRWARDVALALDHAHEAGIAHSDVKPSNIRIDRDGRAVLLDFGLARQSSTDPATVAADIRGLGATLYECLTGVVLPRGAAAADAARPTPLRRLRRDVSRDLEAVVSAALARNDSERYLSARAAADDLDALLALQPVNVVPHRRTQAVRTWLRRHPMMFGVYVGLSLAAAAGAAAWFASERAHVTALTHERDAAQAHRLAAESALVRDDHPALSLLLARESMRIAPSALGRSALARALGECREERTWTLGAGAASAAAIGESTSWAASSDGRVWRLTAGGAAEERAVLRSESGRTLQLRAAKFDAGAGQLIVITRGGDALITERSGDAWSAAKTLMPRDAHACGWLDGGGFALATLGGELMCFDSSGAPSGKIQLSDGEPVHQLAFAGSRVAGASKSGLIIIADVEDGRVTARVRSGGYAGAIALIDGGRRLLTGHQDGTLRAWNACDGTPERDARIARSAILTITPSPDGRRLAVGSFDRNVHVVDAATLEEEAELHGHRGAVLGAEWSADGMHLYTCGGDDDGTVRCWSPENERERRVVAARAGRFGAVRWMPQSRFAVALLDGAKPIIMDVDTHASSTPFEATAMTAADVRVTPDGKHLFTASASGAVAIDEVETGKRCCFFAGAAQAAETPLLSPDGARFERVEPGRGFSIFSVCSGAPTAAVRAEGAAHAAWSPDGKYLFASTTPGKMLKIDASSGAVVASATAAELGYAAVLRASGDGAHVWAVNGPCDAPALAVFGAADLKLSSIYKFGAEGRRLALVSARGERAIVLSGVDAFVATLRGANIESVRRLAGHEGAVVAGSLSPDARWAATASADRTVRVWDARTGELWLCLEGHGETVVHLDWSADGRELLSCSVDGTVRLWTPFDVEASAAAHAPRELTAAERARYDVAAVHN